MALNHRGQAGAEEIPVAVGVAGWQRKEVQRGAVAWERAGCGDVLRHGGPGSFDQGRIVELIDVAIENAVVSNAEVRAAEQLGRCWLPLPTSRGLLAALYACRAPGSRGVTQRRRCAAGRAG